MAELHDAPGTGGSALIQGRAAVERHAWSDAIELFADADVAGGLGPDDLEALAQSYWWKGRLDECIQTRERAYAAFVRDGRPGPGARAAIYLAMNYRDKVAPSVSAGWRNRAARLLQGESDRVEHAWLAALDSFFARLIGDLDGAVGRAERAIELGKRFDDPDAVAAGILVLGIAVIHRGDVADGLQLLDEATAAAASGELQPIIAAFVICQTITACHDLSDVERAGEWARTAKHWCDREDVAGFPGECRVYCAQVDRLQGHWADAERAIRQACAELEPYSPRVAGKAFYELGEIRLRIGDYKAADEAFRRAHSLGFDPQPGLALLRLAEGRVDEAGELLGSSLRRKTTLARKLVGIMGVRGVRMAPRALAVSPELGDETASALGQARLLPARVHIALAAGDSKTARDATRRLQNVANTYQTVPLRAASAHATGATRLADGATNAVEPLLEAVGLFQALGAPYELAQVRTLLGTAYTRAGEAERGTLELETARATFAELGARPDAARVNQLLGGAPDFADAPQSSVTSTFMFTDIVRSTSLVEAIGDHAWSDLIRWHDRTLRTLFAIHRGDEVDHAGDGFFVAFGDPTNAAECAVAIQRALQDHRVTQGFAPQVRIGLHTADAHKDGSTYRGLGVHEAARVGALAAGDAIVASDVVLQALSPRFARSPVHEVTVKGISKPLWVANLNWKTSGLAEVPDHGA
jgi:class 3 adenylate cyclase